jgi:hypothetical protein
MFVAGRWKVSENRWKSCWIWGFLQQWLWIVLFLRCSSTQSGSSSIYQRNILQQYHIEISVASW